MPTLQQRLQALAGEPAGTVAAYLAAALPHAEPSEREALAAAALATRHPAALAAVIGQLDRLGGSVAEKLSRGDLPIEASIRLVRQRGGPRALLNAVAVLRRSGDPRLLGRLAELLGHDSDEVRGRAGEAMLAVVELHAGSEGRRRLDSETSRCIDAALAAAISSNRRGVDEVFLAAALLARPGPGLARILDDPEHPALFALRRVATRTDHRLVRRNLLRWLTSPVLAGQAARWIHRVEGAQQCTDLLTSGHLLLQPARRRAMRRVDKPARCLGDLPTATELAADAQVALVRFIRALSLGGDTRRERLAECVALRADLARLGAMLALLADESPQSDRILERMSLDRDRAVSLLAALRVLGRQDAGAEVVRRLERSPHAAVAARAAVAAAGRSPEALIERWPSLRPAEGAAAALTLLGRQRRALLASLGTALATGGRNEQLAAIAIARRLGVTDPLEPRLIVPAAGPDPRVASAAVAALGDVASPPRVQAVLDALDHPDARVKANAVEALGRMDRRATRYLGDLAESPDNRLRANAVRVLLKARTGLESLRAMLADPDPRHRISAVWLARRARALSTLPDLRRLAARDRFAEVRTRAQAAARLLA